MNLIGYIYYFFKLLFINIFSSSSLSYFKLFTFFFLNFPVNNRFFINIKVFRCRIIAIGRDVFDSL